LTRNTSFLWRTAAGHWAYSARAVTGEQRVQLRTSSVWLITAAWLLCGCTTESEELDNSVPEPAPRGAVDVSITTTGTELDSDGYVLLIDGISAGAVANISTSSIPDLITRAHTVGMTG